MARRPLAEQGEAGASFRESFFLPRPLVFPLQLSGIPENAALQDNGLLDRCKRGRAAAFGKRTAS